MKETVEQPIALPLSVKFHSSMGLIQLTDANGQVIDLSDKANAQYIVTACNTHKGLVEALELALETIKAFHSMGCSKGGAEALWKLYQASPEMKKINQALTLARKGL